MAMTYSKMNPGVGDKKAAKQLALDFFNGAEEIFQESTLLFRDEILLQRIRKRASRVLGLE